jgi:hypothetical protein
MSQAYSDPKRASDPHALPNAEVFHLAASDFADSAEGTWMREAMAEPDADAGSMAGWYWWACLPGCLPDTEPTGPFETEAEALADAQEYGDYSDYDDGEYDGDDRVGS